MIQPRIQISDQPLGGQQQSHCAQYYRQIRVLLERPLRNRFDLPQVLRAIEPEHVLMLNRALFFEYPQSDFQHRSLRPLIQTLFLDKLIELIQYVHEVEAPLCPLSTDLPWFAEYLPGFQ